MSGEAARDGAPKLKLVKQDAQRSRKDEAETIGAPGADGLSKLLKFESALRNAASLKVLQFTLVSDAGDLLGYDQAYLLKETRRGVFQVAAISNFSQVAKDSPLVRRLGKIMSAALKSGSVPDDKATSFIMPPAGAGKCEELAALPFRHALWVPLRHARKGLFAGVLYLRRKEWAPAQFVIAERLSETASHAWLALTGASRLRKRLSLNRGLALIALVLVAVSFVPVPLRILAPFEITPHDPDLVTAPLDGTLQEIAVEPNTRVEKGTVLFRYDATSRSNDYLLAERRLGVARVRRLQLEQSAIRSHEAKAELARARADEKLAKAERDYALENLSRVEVKAKADGLVLFSGRKDWLGRPLQVGQLVMEIARPDDVEVTIDLPVADDIVLEEGLPVRLFLNSDPLNSIDARIIRVAQRAVANEAGQMVYKMTARVNANEQSDAETLIGNRGVAQIESREVSLFFFVMRKPITALRQYFGL